MYQYNPLLLIETPTGYLGKFAKNGKVRNGMAKALKATRKGYDRPILAAAIASPEPVSTAIGVGLQAVPNWKRAILYRNIVDKPGKTMKAGMVKLGQKSKKLLGKLKPGSAN